MSFTPTLNESLAHGWTVVRVALRKLLDAWTTEALEAADFLSARFSRPAAIRLIAEIGPYGVGIEAISRANASTWRKHVAWASYSRELIDEELNEASMSSTTRGLTLRLPEIGRAHV